MSARAKQQFLRRQRISRYYQRTKFDSSVPIEDNLAAPLPVPGFKQTNQEPEQRTPFAQALRNEIIHPPKNRASERDTLAKRNLTKPGRGGRRGGRRGGKQN